MQEQVQTPEQKPQSSQTKERKIVSKRAWIIFICIVIAVVLIILILTILSILGILPANVATILSAIIGCLGLIASIISLYPRNAPEPQGTDTQTPYHIEHIENAYFGSHQPATDTANKIDAAKDTTLVPESLLYKPDVLTDARTIQQRADVVRQVYAQLIQSAISSVVLTGIGGQGKSTLAALVFNYAEQRLSDASSYFQGEALWFSVKEDDTFQMLAEAIMKALQKAISGFGQLPLDNQLAALLNAIRAEQRPRLLVINQFEYLLDEKTGEAKADRPGVREFIDALDREVLPSRILLTSRPLPQGRNGLSGTCLVEHAVDGLTNAEGVDLLRKQVKHIAQQATEKELQLAVRRCEGHGYALRLLASRLQRDASLKVQELLNNPGYAHLWGKDIAVKLLDDIYTQQLDDAKRQLLCSFSIYREAVPLEAARTIMDMPYGDAVSARDALLIQHLLLATGNNCYQLHAIVADYAHTHFVSSNEQTNEGVLRNAHDKAAQYYLKQTCPEPDARRQLKDVHSLVEAVQHYCAAEQWQKAYELMSEEGLFADLRTWGENSLLLELCELLMRGIK